MLATTIVVCIGRLYSCSRAEFAISTDWLVKVITPEFPSTDELEPDQALQFTPSEQKIFDSMSALLAKAGLDYQGHFVEVNGQRIHYLDYGDGPPVLLLHGGGAGSAIWFKQIAGLSKTHRVIAPDHPVFGLSVPVECPGVPAEGLNPRSTWPDAAAYDAQANKLAAEELEV